MLDFLPDVVLMILFSKLSFFDIWQLYKTSSRLHYFIKYAIWNGKKKKQCFLDALVLPIPIPLPNPNEKLTIYSTRPLVMTHQMENENIRRIRWIYGLRDVDKLLGIRKQNLKIVSKDRRFKHIFLHAFL